MRTLITTLTSITHKPVPMPSYTKPILNYINTDFGISKINHRTQELNVVCPNTNYKETVLSVGVDEVLEFSSVDNYLYNVHMDSLQYDTISQKDDRD